MLQGLHSLVTKTKSRIRDFFNFKSTKNKLVLFVSAICTLMLIMVWLLSVSLLAPIYGYNIDRLLSFAIERVTIAIGDEGELSDEKISQISQVIGSGICVELSKKETLEGVVVFEGIGDGCLLHPSEMFFGARTQNANLVYAIRGKAATEGDYSFTYTGKYSLKQKILAKVYDDYIIVASKSLGQVEEAASVMKQQLIFISFIFLFIGIISAFWFADAFTSPLAKLSIAAKRISKGEYDIDVDVSRADEVGELARDFSVMAQELEKTSILKNELVANISHDLRTPLTLIKGYAETIRDITGGDERVRSEQLSIIIDETDRLSTFVESIMELSKHSSGSLSRNLTTFDISELVVDVSNGYKKLSVSNNFIIDCETDEELLINADPAQLERVLHNLIDNAINYIGNDKTIKITAKRQGEAAKITVADNGVGINKQDLPFIFDRYFRAREHKGKAGSGLGLSIVKAILVNHKYNFGVDSQEGRGSSFWFICPLI